MGSSQVMKISILSRSHFESEMQESIKLEEDKDRTMTFQFMNSQQTPIDITVPLQTSIRDLKKQLLDEVSKQTNKTFDANNYDLTDLEGEVLEDQE